jgi:hypothetical protein
VAPSITRYTPTDSDCDKHSIIFNKNLELDVLEPPGLDPFYVQILEDPSNFDQVS